MTIRLLSTYDGFPPNSIITIDPALEAAFIAAGNATANLTGGVVAYRERQPVMIQPAVQKRGTVNLIANRSAILPLTEGSVLTITPAAGTTGTYQRYDAAGVAVGALVNIGSAKLILGPFEGDFTVEIKCTTGALAAKTRPGSATAVQPSAGLVQPAGATVIVRPVSNAQPAGAYDTSTFREIIQTPIVGLALVSAGVETTTATATVIDSIALAAGRNYSNDDPVDGSGAPAVWQVLTAISVSGAADAGNGVFGIGWTPYVLLNIPAPTDGGIGGYVYAGLKLASGTRLGQVGGAPTRSIADYENYISAKVPAMKFRALRKSGQDYVNSNQNSMGANSPSYGSEFAPITMLRIIPVTRVISIAHFGDSTGDGLGTGTPLVQPNHYNWALIAANRLIQEQAVPVVVANFCHEGKKTLYNIQNRLGTFLADPEFNPSAVIIQPFSINDGATTGALTQAIVDAAMVMALTQAAAARKRGIIPIFRTVIPSVSMNATQDGFRKAANAALIASGEVVIDIDAVVTDGASPARLLPAYSLDGTHMSAAGNEACAAPAMDAIRKIFFR